MTFCARLRNHGPPVEPKSLIRVNDNLLKSHVMARCCTKVASIIAMLL